MAYEHHLNNPSHKIVNDTVVRAISLATGEDWQKTYINLAIQGFFLHDMPSSSAVWSAYLAQRGFKIHTFSEEYQDNYTVDDFVATHSDGVYILICDNILVPLINGTYYDYAYMGNAIPQYYWKKEN